MGLDLTIRLIPALHTHYVPYTEYDIVYFLVPGIPHKRKHG